MNLNITIINGMMIKYPHDSQNYRAGFGRRGLGFEVNFCMLTNPLYWWISWFITMKVIELVHVSSKNWWEEVRDTDDAGISLVSNYSISFSNSILLNTEI